MHRHVFGALGLAVLLSGVALVAYDHWVPAAHVQVFIVRGGLVRAGLLTLALWFAMPDRADQIPWPRIAAIAVAALLVALRPRVIFVLIPVIVAVGIAAYVLKPRPKPGARVRHRMRR